MRKSVTEEIQTSIKDLIQAQKETDRFIKESKKETDRRIRELDHLFGNQWGKLMESLAKGDLIKLLKARGIEVEELTQETSVKRSGENYEFDMIAINGQEVVVVEVKTTLSIDDVTHFIVKMNDFKKVFPRYSDKKVYGAMAYLKSNQGSSSRADGEGLFVIRATGSSASITNKENFNPKIF